jgi:phage terminase large subunit-like protein
MINEQAMPNDINIRDAIKFEYAKCAKDPVYFMRKYCMIQHPLKGRILFNLYKFQEDTLRELQQYDYNIILKSRQLGISTVAAGYSMWMMNFHNDKNILVIATNQNTAKILVTKIRFMYQHLPSWMKEGVVEDNKLSLKLKNGSQVKAVASSESAGRGESISLLLIDECLTFDTEITVKNTETNEIKQIKIGDLYNEL